MSARPWAHECTVTSLPLILFGFQDVFALETSNTGCRLAGFLNVPSNLEHLAITFEFLLKMSLRVGNIGILTLLSSPDLVHAAITVC